MGGITEVLLPEWVVWVGPEYGRGGLAWGITSLLVYPLSPSENGLYDTVDLVALTKRDLNIG